MQVAAFSLCPHEAFFPACRDRGGRELFVPFPLTLSWGFTIRNQSNYLPKAHIHMPSYWVCFNILVLRGHVFNPEQGEINGIFYLT